MSCGPEAETAKAAPGRISTLKGPASVTLVKSVAAKLRSTEGPAARSAWLLST